MKEQSGEEEASIKFYLRILLSFATTLPFLHGDNPKDTNTEEDRIQENTEMLLQLLQYKGAGQPNILQNYMKPSTL